jgi:hypothetical protein
VVAATLAGAAQYFEDRPVALRGRDQPARWFTFPCAALRAPEERSRAVVEASVTGVMILEQLPLRPDGLRDSWHAADRGSARRQRRARRVAWATFPMERAGRYDSPGSYRIAIT